MFTEIGNDIQKAAKLLQDDQIVAIPTETVYGLAGNALSETAVAKIYAAKNRPSFNPLILHIAGIDQIGKYAEADEQSLKIAAAFMPGPITLLLPKKNNVPDITTAGSAKLALRVPDHPLTLALLQMIDFPLAAPSANPSGYISPTTALHVLDGLNGIIPYIIDGGSTKVGLESTICEVAGDHIILHRTGGISASQLKMVTGLEVIEKYQAQPVQMPETPGQLKSHYAPHTPLFRGHIPELIKKYSGKKMAVISFQHDYSDNQGTKGFVLSEKGLLPEAANRLFNCLREIDTMDYDVILTEVFPNEGIGSAINDRLDRAQFIHK